MHRDDELFVEVVAVFADLLDYGDELGLLDGFEGF